MLRVLPDVWTARVLPDPRALGRVPSLHTSRRAAVQAQKDLDPDPTRSAPDAGVSHRGSFHRGMADDEEMDVEKDSKEGPRFVVKKWCGARTARPCRVGSLWWWQQPGLRLGV